MLSAKQGKLAVRILIPLLIALISVCVLVNAVPKTAVMRESMESLERSTDTVQRFTGTTMGLAVAITFMPSDYANPLADTLADLGQYCVFVLIALFLERLLVVEGVKAALLYVIPTACGLHILSTLLGNERIRGFSYKIAILGLAIALAVPCSTHLSDALGQDYLAYVDQTIAEASAGTEKANEAAEGSEGETIAERVTNAFSAAVKSADELVQYFKNCVYRCANSVAIMIVTSFVIPLLTFLALEWILNALFQLGLPYPAYRRRHAGGDGGDDGNGGNGGDNGGEGFLGRLVRRVKRPRENAMQ